MPKKSGSFLNLTEFKSVILSSVCKKKNVKNLKKRPSYLEKRYFQIKLINYEGVIILSTGETPWGNFRGKSSSLVFMLFAYFYLHHVLDKIPMWKLFALITLMEKSKAEKKSLGKEKNKKPAQRRKKYLHFAKERSNLNFCA